MIRDAPQSKHNRRQTTHLPGHCARNAATGSQKLVLLTRGLVAQGRHHTDLTARSPAKTMLRSGLSLGNGQSLRPKTHDGKATAQRSRKSACGCQRHNAPTVVSISRKKQRCQPLARAASPARRLGVHPIRRDCMMAPSPSAKGCPIALSETGRVFLSTLRPTSLRSSQSGMHTLGILGSSPTGVAGQDLTVWRRLDWPCWRPSTVTSQC